MKAILIDDEKHALKSLEYEIEQVCPQLEVVCKINDPRKAKELIEKWKPDLIFLDIEMPWMSGFDLLQSLDQLDFEIIFVTAYDQYAIKAFKFSAIDYLLKPVDMDELKTAVNKVMLKKTSFNSDHLKALMDNLSNKKEAVKKIVLPTSEGLEFIQIENIVRCQSESNYSRIFLLDSREIFLAKTLKEIEALLQDNGFFRIHNSHLISEKYITKYIASEGGFVMMKDGRKVPISRSKKSEFLSKFRL